MLAKIILKAPIKSQLSTVDISAKTVMTAKRAKLHKEDFGFFVYRGLRYDES